MIGFAMCIRPKKNDSFRLIFFFDTINKKRNNTLDIFWRICHYSTFLCDSLALIASRFSRRTPASCQCRVSSGVTG